MAIHFVDKRMCGYMPILEASAGHLLGGRKIEDGVVCDTFFEALTALNQLVEQERQAFRKIRVARGWSSRGWCPVW